MKFDVVLENSDVQNSTRMNKFSPEKIQEIMDKLHGGTMNIEFMNNPKLGKHFIIQFGDPYDKNDRINYFFNHHKKNRKQHFQSVSSVINHIKTSLLDIYGSDMKMVYRELFNPEEMEAVFRTINSMMISQPLKSLSLSYKNSRKNEKNTDWDAQVIFKKSMESYMRDGKYQIQPVLTRQGRPAKIVGPDEVEQPMKKRELRDFLSSL